MANSYLTWQNSTATNSTKFTMSGWVKRGNLNSSSYNCIMSCRQTSSSNAMGLWFGEDKVFFNFGTSASASTTGFDTSAKVRDVNGWYHIVVAGDASQSGTDKLKVWINGTQQTSFVTDNRSSFATLEYDFGNTSYPIQVGRKHDGTFYWDGSMSHIHFVDGTAYQASDFGLTDSTTGEWKINTSPSVTYGNNGFFILKDGNSGTDQSGEGNNFTVGGGTLTKTEDNPSNVFATLNPLVNNAGEMMLLTNGNTSCQSNAAQGNSWKLAVSTLGMTSGKYYLEIKFDNVHNCYNNGVMGSNILTANTSNPMNQTGYTGFYNYDGGEIRKDNVVTTQDYGTYATNDIMGVACDMDNYTITFYKNGSAFVSNVALSTTGRDVVFPCSVFYNTNNTGIPQASYNFGNGYFGTTAISSAGSNGNGSLFEYDVPSGYYALNTKNINTYG